MTQELDAEPAADQSELPAGLFARAEVMKCAIFVSSRAAVIKHFLLPLVKFMAESHATW